MRKAGVGVLNKMAAYPHYTYPRFGFFRVGLNVFFGGQRSFRRDGQECLALLDPPLQVLGAQNLPQSGPCLIAFNHYYRPGFNAWWMALALAATLPMDIHFVMTGELTYPGKWYAPLGSAGSRWLLWRLANIYGFTRMPPMPPREKDVERRAHAVRETLSYARAHPQAVLALAPEGGDQPGGVLSMPALGAGRFMLLLAGLGFRILPLGAYESDGSLCLNFGSPYELTIPRGLPADEKDRLSAAVVMGSIAPLLPETLRGDFQIPR